MTSPTSNAVALVERLNQIRNETMHPAEEARTAIEAADVIQSLAARIAELEGRQDRYRVVSWNRFDNEAALRSAVSWLCDEVVAAERGKSTTRAVRKRQAKNEAINRIMALQPADESQARSLLSEEVTPERPTTDGGSDAPVQPDTDRPSR